MKQITELFNYADINRAVVYSIPENWGGEKAILDFHGNGEMAKYNDPIADARLISARSGLQYLIKNGKEIDYLVISPQSWGYGWDLKYANEVFEYAQKKYGFKWAGGIGISMGGRVDEFANAYPDKLIGTVSIAGVRARHGVNNRLHIPQWTIVGSTDTVVSPYKESLPFMKSIQDAGGKSEYTLFKGVGHGARLWNDAINGTISVDQIEATEFTGRKEYVRSEFPIGDWFESLITASKPKPELTMNGVKYKVYETGTQSKIPDLSQFKPIKEGVSKNFDISVSPISNYFSVEFESNIKISEPGSYVIYIASDDGSKLYIDDQLVIDNDGLHGVITKHGSINLSEGYHKIRVVYFENSGGNVLRVNWGKVGINIPDDMLFADYDSPITYNISITGATESEKDAILNLVGNKAKII